MAKSKSKLFYRRFIQKLKNQSNGLWNKELCDQLEAVWALPDEDISEMHGNPLLASMPATFRAEACLHDALESLIDFDDWEDLPRIYPGLVANWERLPKSVTFSPDCIKHLADAPVYGDAKLDRLDRLFPGCLMLDVRDLKWTFVDSYPLQAVFAYLSYDSERRSPLLLFVGFDNRGGHYSLESRLLIQGNTLDAARGRTDEHAWAHRADLLSRRATGSRYLIGDWYFSPLDYEPEFNELVDRLLGFLLSDEVVLEERRYSDVLDVQVSLLAKNEGEGSGDEAQAALSGAEDASASQGASSLIDEPIVEDAADSPENVAIVDAEPLGGTSESAAVEMCQGEIPSDDGDSAEPQCDSVLASGESELWHRRYDELLAESVADKSAMMHHLKQAQQKTNMLKAENAALRTRAGLIDQLALPTNPLEALQLAANAYPDRLIVLDDAEKSAEAFKNGSTSEVWDVLRSLAVVLHPLIFRGSDTGDPVSAYEAESGFELTLREVKQTKRNDDLSRLKRVRYKGEWHDMTPHAKGRSRRLGETLRVHFFADYEEQKLVIAYCGDHIRSYRTSSL